MQGECQYRSGCSFSSALDASALLRITYATQYRRCKKLPDSCARFQLLLRGRKVPDNLLPDGSIASADFDRCDTARRVLVADDLPVFRTAMAVLVRSACGENVSIVEAGSGEDALAALRENPGAWMALVTDFNMGGMTGYELITHMRRDDALAELPVIVFSSDASSAMRDACTAMPGVCWLTKSPDPRPFVSAWRAVVG